MKNKLKGLTAADFQKAILEGKAPHVGTIHTVTPPAGFRYIRRPYNSFSLTKPRAYYPPPLRKTKENGKTVLNRTVGTLGGRASFYPSPKIVSQYVKDYLPIPMADIKEGDFVLLYWNAAECIKRMTLNKFYIVLSVEVKSLNKTGQEIIKFCVRDDAGFVHWYTLKNDYNFKGYKLKKLIIAQNRLASIEFD